MDWCVVVVYVVQVGVNVVVVFGYVCDIGVGVIDVLQVVVYCVDEVVGQLVVYFVGVGQGWCSYCYVQVGQCLVCFVDQLYVVFVWFFFLYQVQCDGQLVFLWQFIDFVVVVVGQIVCGQQV